MARLIEFFTRTGELVLDPFAGVGGTLLGAAIARGPRRAIGIELEPRWAASTTTVVARPRRRARRRGPAARRPRPGRSGRAARLRPVRLRAAASATRSRSCRRSPTASIDFVATDPPYNVAAAADDGRRRAGRDARQPADRLRDGHRLTRRTSRTPPTTRPSSTGWATSSARSRASCGRARYAVVIVRDAYQDGRYLFTGSDLAARAAAVGLVPKGDLIWYQAGHAAAAVRLSARVRPEHRPPAHPRAAQGSGAASAGPLARREVGGEDVVVDVRRSRPSSRCRRRSASWRSGSRRPPSAPTTSPRVILWSQPRLPSGRRTSQ